MSDSVVPRAASEITTSDLQSAPAITGHWELDLGANHLQWSDEQYRIYGYQPHEIDLNDEFFLMKTTHVSEINRIRKIIRIALKEQDGYHFKRKTIRKDGSIGFVETTAKIIRSTGGIPQRIVGITLDLSQVKATDESKIEYPKQFEALYSNYNKVVFAKILSLVKEKNIAKDLCQEVFIKAWNNLSTYNCKKGELYTWLINIARNHCIDYFRSKHFRLKKNTARLEHVVSYDKHQEAFNLDRFDVHNLLAKLEPKQKELVELLFLRGFTQNEVAKLQNMPLGSVKTKSRSALKNLRLLALDLSELSPCKLLDK